MSEAEFTWACSQCGRRVPRRMGQCRCGAVRAPVDPVNPSNPVNPVNPVAGTAGVAIGARREGLHPVLIVSVLVALAIVGVALVLALAWRPAPAAGPAAPLAQADGPAAVAAEPDPDLQVPDLVALTAVDEPADTTLSVEEIVSRSLPAVVQVESPNGTASGFFVSRDTLLTTAHVAGSEKSVTLRLAGGQARRASVTQVAYSVYLAVLTIDIVDFDQVSLPLARPEDVRIGADVFALGSPLGLQNSVSQGIISGAREYVYDRIGRQSVHVVQTDAAISPGNSGGPLVNRYGHVVGVNTARLSLDKSEGIGFAIDMRYARRLLGPDFAPAPRSVP